MEAVRYDHETVLMLIRKMQISGLDIILSVLHKYIDQTQCGWPTSQGDDSQSALWLLFTVYEYIIVHQQHYSLLYHNHSSLSCRISRRDPSRLSTEDWTNSSKLRLANLEIEGA